MSGTYIYETLVNTSKIIIFQLAYSSLGSQVTRAYAGSSGSQAGPQPGQDAFPLQGTPTLTQTGAV